MAVTPYPYRRWPRMSRAQAASLTRAAQRLPRCLDAMSLEAGRLLGTTLACTSRPPCPAGSAAPAAPLAAALFEVDVDGHCGRMAVEVDASLAGTLIDRLLGGEGDGDDYALCPLNAIERGVLAYLAARLAGLAGCLRLCDVVATRDALAGFLGGGPLVVWPLELTLDARGSCARVWLTALALELLPQTPKAVPSPDWLAVTALALDAVVSRTRLPRSELCALSRGDIVIPERCTLSPDRGGFCGQVELAIAGSLGPLLRCRGERQRLEIQEVRNRSMTTTKRGTSDMTAEADAKGDAAPEARSDAGFEAARQALIDQAPVELEVCVARFRLSVAELSRLAPGQVLETREPIGCRASLRSAGHEIAQGELVEVDGDVGFRVLRLPEG